MIHDGGSPYDQFEKALHQQCLNHLLRRADNRAATATRGAVGLPRQVAALLGAGLRRCPSAISGDLISAPSNGSVRPPSASVPAQRAALDTPSQGRRNALDCGAADSPASTLNTGTMS